MISIGTRRSERFHMDVPLVICGESQGQRSLREDTHTLILSAYGVLVLLESAVRLGEKIVVVNPQNRREREGTVVYLAPHHENVVGAGIDFAAPAPDFW